MADEQAIAPVQASGVVVPQSVAALGYQQLELRKRIAMQMMSQHQKAYPKNLGQGLASFGNSLGDIGMMQMLMRQQQAQDAAVAKEKQDALDEVASMRTGGV
jgi:hypothetical protein